MQIESECRGFEADKLNIILQNVKYEDLSTTLNELNHY